MFVYYKLCMKPASPTISTPRCGDQGKTAIPGIKVVYEEARIFITSRTFLQPQFLQPQQAPHKHETEVANLQYLLHRH